MLELTDKDYILGIWFVEFKDVSNTMSLIKRADKENSWEGFVRIRNYQPGSDPFDGRDRKTFFEIKEYNMTEPKMIEKMNEVFNSIKEYPPATSLSISGISDHVIVSGSIQDLQEKCKDKPWFHFRRSSNE